MTVTPDTEILKQAQPEGHPIARMAGYIKRVGAGDRAALARLNPQGMLPHQMAALSRTLLHSGLEPHYWEASLWRRWSLIAHGIALAGHDDGARLGQQLSAAGVAESRVTKLLVSRDEALMQMLPRLFRLIASRQVKPNWYDLSLLILKDQSSDPRELERLEGQRLRIAGDYYRAQAQ